MNIAGLQIYFMLSFIASLGMGCQEMGEESFNSRSNSYVAEKSGSRPTPNSGSTVRAHTDKVTSPGTDHPTSSPEPIISQSPTPSPSPSSSSEVAYVYPELQYFGVGNMVHSRRDEPYPVTRNVMLKPNQTLMDVDLIEFKSSNGNVDSRIRDKVGLTRFKRTEVSKVKALKDLPGDRSGPIPFAIYADSIQVSLKDGTKNNFRFSRPMPVFITPGNQNRYKDISAAPIVVESSVQARLEKENGQVEEVSFNLRLKLSLNPNSSNSTKIGIVMEANNPQDDQLANGNEAGKFYGFFPLDKRSDFEIDAVKERIMRLVTSTDFNDEGRRQKLEFDYRLCTEKISDKSSSFECGMVNDE